MCTQLNEKELIVKSEISLEDTNMWLKDRGLLPFPVKSIFIDARTEAHLKQSAEAIKKLLEDWVWMQQTKTTTDSK
jgi:hypothetical protein